MNIYRPTWVEISRKAFYNNIKQIKKKLSKNTEILAVVKANAYGHGIEKISQWSIDNGVKMLGVALIEEGILLRDKGIKKPILILGSIWPLKNFRDVIEYKLTPAISSIESAKRLSQLSSRRDRITPVHIKIDTGMGRIGFSWNGVSNAIKRMADLPGIRLEGVFTHLAAADKDEQFTRMQIRRMDTIINDLKRDNISFRLSHISNSTAVLKYPLSHYNIVRPGISLYGLEPYRGFRKVMRLQPVLQLKTHIVYLKRVPKGTTISYGRTWRSPRPSVIATMPIGYADGYNRLLSNRGEVLIRGERFPIVGRVCMDMFMVDVTRLKYPGIGEEVVLIGAQGDDQITAEEIAEKIGTINYEVTCAISSRVPRIYI